MSFHFLYPYLVCEPPISLYVSVWCVLRQPFPQASAPNCFLQPSSFRSSGWFQGTEEDETRCSEIEDETGSDGEPQQRGLGSPGGFVSVRQGVSN